ncbi:MAG: tRNA (adenosine(37)-N6)-dimethylallyltransferase MiaA [Polyangiaceae bacterium]
MSVDEARVAACLTLLEENPDALLAFVGPTASGKTDLAMRVCEKIGGEIVSVDSVQVYRGFDIGSGKPTQSEQARVRHHLIDIAEPLDALDAARFAEMGHLAIAEIRSRRKIPVLCGGTFLWMKALLFGLVEIATANDEIRARHRKEVETHGRSALHEQLKKVDPEAAARLHPNDFVRVSRALEVHELTGKTLSFAQRGHRFSETRHDARLVAIQRTPEELTSRIRSRVENWLGNGWIEETDALRASGFHEARAMKTVGYLEITRFLDGTSSREELGETIVRRTRVFARRQRTWLNRPGAPLVWL